MRSLYAIGLGGSLLLALAGCSNDSGPYLELQGGGFIFNYRIAEATVGLVAVAVRPLPENATVEASFENPAGGPAIVLDEKAKPASTKFAFTTPPLTGIVAGKDYKVTLRLLDANGMELEKIEKNFRSQVDQALLPEKPLTIGPGYTKNPEAKPDGG